MPFKPFQRDLLVVGMLAGAVLVAGCGTPDPESASQPSSQPASSSSSSGDSAGGYGKSSSTATPAASTATVALVSTKSADKLGTVLAGAKGRTLYIFEADKGSASACTGACAAAWPPLLTSGTPTATGQAKSADLGTTKRADGTTQVTYKGQPVYYFVKDKEADDAYGQDVNAFGADWYALAPSGKKIDGDSGDDDSDKS